MAMESMAAHIISFHNFINSKMFPVDREGGKRSHLVISERSRRESKARLNFWSHINNWEKAGIHKGDMKT